MSKGVKVIVIIGLVVLWVILSMLMVAANQEAGGDGPGFMGLILLVGLIAGIRAVWKHNPDQNNNISEPKDDRYKLDKD